MGQINGQAWSGATRPTRVVVVEDNHLIALDLEDALTRTFRCNVDIVTSSGIEALARIADVQPDVVITDLSILLRDNLEPADFLSTGHRLFIITGDAQSARTHCGTGMYVLHKPFNTIQLVRRIGDATIDGPIAGSRPEARPRAR